MLSEQPDLVVRVFQSGEDFLAARELLEPGDVALAVRAMKAGAIDLLEKPCDPEALVELVHATLDRLRRGPAAAASHAAARARLDRLSARERDVLAGLIAGRRNKVIAEELGIGARTVEIYRGNMMDKLGAESLADALRVAFAAGAEVRDCGHEDGRARDTCNSPSITPHANT